MKLKKCRCPEHACSSYACEGEQCSKCGRAICGNCYTTAGAAKGQHWGDPEYDRSWLCFKCDDLVRQEVQ